jgi:hypothetical protein
VVGRSIAQPRLLVFLWVDLLGEDQQGRPNMGRTDRNIGSPPDERNAERP